MQRDLVLVLEDQAESRAWMAALCETAFPGVQVAQFGDLAQACAWLRAADQASLQRLRLALVDLGLPDGSGIGFIRDLTTRHPAATAVVATIHDDDANLLNAIAAGASGYLLKDQEASAIAAQLRRIDDGEPPLSPSIARRMMEHFARQARPSPNLAASPARSPAADDEAAVLTHREQEVLALLGRGSRVAEAAQRLGLTEQTVATYVKTIYRKLRISSRAEAALAAQRRGLI
jgi:DNA-binding NarL/FixJ family response regulator